jgi:hypothetical protein
MWAVGRVTNSAGDFTIPMVSVSVAMVLAAIGGWEVSRRPVGQPQTPVGVQEA